MENLILWCTRITVLAAAAGILWKVYRRFADAVEGIRCILRGEMLRIYYHNREDRKIRQYEYENFVMLYEAYKALKGNSFIDRIYAEVKEWDIVT